MIAMAALGACGSETGTAAPVAETVPADAADEPEQEPVSEEPADEPVEQPSTEPVADDEPSADETFTMPNLVGMNLQKAQDELQDLGSYVLSQDDATGKGRFQMSDRNWKVCSQDQEPGRVLSIAELVNVEAVKLDESCP